MSMMHEITSGLARKRAKRIGRGESGKGKTSGRGNKGSKARVGRPWWKPGYEGGQTPIFRRLPKRGFSNDPFAKEYSVVNISSLEEAFEAGATVDVAALKAAGLVSDTTTPVKILGDGTLTKKLTIKADWYSKSAIEKVGQLGGEVLNAKGEKFELPKPKKKFVKRAPAKKEQPTAEAKPEGEAK